MRILLRIAVSMMHSVHHPISTWYQKRRALYQPGTHIKNPLPVFAGTVHFMRTEPMQKKRMKKQRQEPMEQKKTKNGEHTNRLGVS